jgi:hypothetical protein
MCQYDGTPFVFPSPRILFIPPIWCLNRHPISPPLTAFSPPPSFVVMFSLPLFGWHLYKKID